MKVKVLLIMLLILAFSCSKDDPTSSTHQFAGNWSFTVSGQATGNGNFHIDNDGSFSVLLNFTTSSGTTSNVISGKVSTDGTLQDGKILYNGQQIGTVSGTFTGNAGSGSYSSNVSGTWAAAKQ